MTAIVFVPAARVNDACSVADTRGTYRTAEPRVVLAGSSVRVAAYGDPAALPFEWWANALARVDGWTGYTHAWRTCDPRFALLLMASVETEDEAEAAHAMGWRTFRARPSTEPVRVDEFVCPASREAGHRTTCEACQLCRGASSPAKHVTIELHGQRFTHKRGAEMTATRDRLWDIRRQLEAGQRVVVPIQHRGEFFRIMLALRLFYRRRGITHTLHTRCRDGEGTAEVWIGRPGAEVPRRGRPARVASVRVDPLRPRLVSKT